MRFLDPISCGRSPVKVMPRRLGNNVKINEVDVGGRLVAPVAQCFG